MSLQGLLTNSPPPPGRPGVSPAGERAVTLSLSASTRTQASCFLGCRTSQGRDEPAQRLRAPAAVVPELGVFLSTQVLGSVLSSYGCSIAQSCLSLCNPIDCSTPGFTLSFTISQNMLKLTSIDLVMPTKTWHVLAILIHTSSTPNRNDYFIPIRQVRNHCRERLSDLSNVTL